MDRKKYLFRNTAVFVLGNLGSKLITFFLVPLYTQLLSTAQYGTIDLISTITTVLVPIVTFNISESVMRFCLDKGANKNNIINIGLMMMIFSMIISSLMVPVLSNASLVSNYIIYVYLFVISNGCCTICLSILRGKEYLLRYSIGSIINTFLIAVFNILFLYVFKLGIEGYLMAFILSNFLTAIYAFVMGKAYLSLRVFKINKPLLIEMLKFSVVLIPNSLMWWIMNSSDHIMVTAMISVSANGIYAISYKIPTLLSNLGNIFLQAWNYSAIKEDDSDDRDKFITNVFNNLYGVLIIALTGSLMVIKPFLKLYVSPDYYIAWKYTPFLFLGVLFLTVASFLSSAYTVHKDSVGFLKSGIPGAIINVLFNWILIPIFGINGASIATCASYLCVFLYRAVDTRKYISVKMFNTKNALGLLMIVISMLFIYIDNYIGLIVQIFAFLLACLIYYKVIVVIMETILRKKTAN